MGSDAEGSRDFDTVFHEIDADLETERLKDRFQATLDNSADVIVFTRPDGTITYANHAARSFLADSGHVADLFDPESRERLNDECLPQTYADGFWAGELALALADDYSVPVNVVMLSHSNDHGELEYLSVVAHDIAILKEAQHALEAQATHDALTGLPNRPRFLELLRRALARIGRSGESVAVMFSDLDGFKAVNDGLGHDAGDELLIEVGRRMQSCLREGDVVARFGGDEFVIMLADVDDLETARRVAERLMIAIEQPIALTEGEGRVGTSIGIAIASSADVDPEAILAEADTAMYRAKQLGKRRYQVFDDDLRARAGARRALMDDLAGALGRREFSVSYSPVVDVRDGSLVSVESAMGWLHPRRGTLGATEFLPLARELGIVLDLNRMLIRDVAERWAEWTATAFEKSGLTTWVTIGSHEILRGELDRLLAEVAEEFALAPGAVGFEIPLEVLTKHPTESQRLTQALRWMGVRVAIDDFGTHPFIPAQLQSFSVDTVKLDRQYVRTLSDSPESISALSGIVAFARALDIEVVAKGVERLEEVELLQEVGCSLLQGPVVTQPMSAALVATLLDGPVPWAERWPARSALGGPLSRPQVVERLLRLRESA